MIAWGILALAALVTQETDVSYKETVTTYAALAETRFTLVAIDGTPVETRSAIEFLPDGMIRGDGPCNAFGAPQTAEWPAFSVDLIRATRMACPDLPLERQFFERLQAMETARFDGDVLVLENADGERLDFRAQD